MSDGFYFGGSSAAAQSDTQQSNNPFMQPRKQQPQFNSFAPPPATPPTPNYYQTQPQQQQYYNPQQQQFYNPQQQQQQQFFTPTTPPPLPLQQQQQKQQYTITWRGILSSFVPSSELEGDKPLLEELDVNLNHIRRKTIAVLNPLSIMKPLDEDLMTDGDLAGPFIFAFILGMSLLVLNGRVHFGFIYGLGLLGWASIWLILNAMSETSQIPTIRCASILGYCILPMVILSLVSLVLPLKGGLPGLVAGATTVGWSTLASSNMFVSSLQMKDQRILVAYPVGLFYFSFALMTIF